jgi:predicted phosphodiesterase
MGMTKLCAMLASLAAAGAACSHDASSDDDGGSFVTTGGTLAIDGCGYGVTTRLGAEAPRLGNGAVGSDPEPRQVHLGIMGDPRTSIVAQWRTADEDTKVSTIRFAAGQSLSADQLTETRTGIHFGYQSSGGDHLRVHQAHLCGLMPNTSYSYQVGSQGHFSPVYTFHTAPDLAASPDAQVVLGFVGDSRGGYDVWQQLVRRLQERTPDVVLFSGDAITFGSTQAEWDEFFTRAEPLFATTAVIAAHGNHEMNAINYYSQLALPGDQQNFGIDYGHAHLTVANDTPEDPNALTGAFRDAIAQDFEASMTATWRLFMHHQPMFSESLAHGSNLALRAAWAPLVDQYAIDLVLNGHDHDYQVTKPLRNGLVQPTSAQGTVYVIAGGAGAELYDLPTAIDQGYEYAEQTYSAGTLTVTARSLTFEAFRPDDTKIPVGFSKTKP